MTRFQIQGEAYEVEAVLLDKDGTLLDFISMWGFWSERVIAAFDSHLEGIGLKPLETESIPAIWGTQHDESGYIAEYDRNGPLAMGTMSDLYAVLAWQGYVAGMSWAAARAAAIHCGAEADAALERERPARLIAGVKLFLDECRQKGVPLAVVTADETEAALRHLDWLGIRSYFQAVIGTDQVERGKPFGDMAELACSRLGVQPARTAIIGDTNGDMLMARAAGAGLRIALAQEGLSSKEGRGSLNLTGGMYGVDPIPSRLGLAIAAAYPDASHIIRGYKELRLGG